MSDNKVTYDVFRDWMNRPVTPYRSEALYRDDMRAAMHARIGAPLQVIKERGDLIWVNATKIRTELVDPELGMLRHVVRLEDGTEHKVSEDRVRVRP